MDSLYIDWFVCLFSRATQRDMPLRVEPSIKRFWQEEEEEEEEEEEKRRRRRKLAEGARVVCGIVMTWRNSNRRRKEEAEALKTTRLKKKGRKKEQGKVNSQNPAGKLLFTRPRSPSSIFGSFVFFRNVRGTFTDWPIHTLALSLSLFLSFCRLFLLPTSSKRLLKCHTYAHRQKEKKIEAETNERERQPVEQLS